MIPLTYWLMAAILTPLLGALVISRLDKLPDYREAVTLVTASILFSINVYLFNHLDAASTAQFTIAEPIEGLAISFVLNQFGLMFALIASGLWIATSIYAIGYMRAHHEKNQTRFLRNIPIG